MKPVVDSLVRIPYKMLEKETQRRIAAALQVSSRYDESDDDAIHFYHGEDNHVGIPVYYGMRIAKKHGIKLIDNRTLGARAIFRGRPTPRDANQSAFFSTLIDSAKARSAVLAVAPTGTGKTVAGLNAIAELGRAALVIVPSVALARQWQHEAVRHLKLASESVHVFHGGKCKWDGFKLVIAVIHNLCEGQWPKEFYQHFGTVLWDEAHRVGAVSFSQSVMWFPARYRIALTATPVRKDGRSALLDLGFGPPCKSVKGNTLKPLDCTMYVLGSQIPIKHRSFPNFAATLGVMTSAVASNELRNRLAANVIANAWKESRNILALSDRIEQLHVIKALLVERANLPESDIGIFVGGLSAAEQNRIKESCRIILATFGMFKEGQDVPRMDFGMDLSPRSDAVQQLGRIRRAYHNKPHPMWVTFFDHNGSSIIQGMATSRIKDARSCGCNIVNVFDNCGQHGEGALRYLQSKMKI